MSMANGFGLARQQAYDLSEGLTELAYDLSSLYNEDTEQSVLRLQSALAGEIEPIRRLGISISQATLQEYALAHGIDESVMSMTEQEKALLRSLVLMEGASRIGAIGDFAKPWNPRKCYESAAPANYSAWSSDWHGVCSYPHSGNPMGSSIC